MNDEPHIVSKMFLAGGIVENGVIGISDRSYVHAAAQLLKDLNLPLSEAFKQVADYKAPAETIPFDFANINPLHGGRDYLAMPAEERDLLMICNIPTERRDRIDTLEDFQAHRAWRKAQADAGIPDNDILSERHSADNWRQKMNQDHPYVVTFHGSPETLRADILQAEDYVSLHPPQLQLGVLIDRHYLRDVYFKLSQDWVDQKKMPVLIPVIHSLDKHPARTVFDWDYNTQRYVAQAPQKNRTLDF